MTENIVAMNADTFVTWDAKNTYNVYRVNVDGFTPIDTFECSPTFDFAHAKKIGESWFNDSFGLGD